MARITKRERQGKTVYTTLVNLPVGPDGKRRQKRISGPIKKEVENEQARLLASIADGKYNSEIVVDKKQTLEAYLADWLKHAATTLRPASVGRYGEMVRLHITPALGKIQLAKLTPQQVSRMYADLLAKPLSRTTVNNIHGVFHKALDQALRWGLVNRNVTEMVDPPKKDKPEYITLTSEQLRLFLAEAAYDEYSMIWRLAVYTGLRRGELLGLKWEDIDFEKSMLSVRRTYSRGEKHVYSMGQTKTASGRRQVTFPDNITADLKAHFIKQMGVRLDVGDGYSDQGLVFTDELGRPIHPNTLTGHFHKILERASLPLIRIHDLRHGHATMLMEDGVHPKVVSERLGHANTGITMDLYSHVTPTMQRHVSNRLERLIEGPEK